MLDALILCGGRGTRLAGVLSDVPKPLAPVAGRPFLDYQLALLAASGMVRSATLAIHHLAHQFLDHYAAHQAPLPLRFVREETPLGTGGALLNALAGIESATVLCLNGDTLLGGDIASLIAAHRAFGPGLTMGLVEMRDTSRYGRVTLDGTGRVLSFSEKAPGSGAGLINAGIYVIDRSVLDPYNGEVLSMEANILPSLVDRGLVHGFLLPGPFIDIGLPETYAAAGDLLSSLRRGAHQAT